MKELPRYASEVIRMLTEGEIQPGTINHVIVLHDDNCAIWRGQRCDCDFEISRQPVADDGR